MNKKLYHKAGDNLPEHIRNRTVEVKEHSGKNSMDKSSITKGTFNAPTPNGSRKGTGVKTADIRESRGIDNQNQVKTHKGKFSQSGGSF